MFWLFEVTQTGHLLFVTQQIDNGVRPNDLVTACRRDNVTDVSKTGAQECAKLVTARLLSRTSASEVEEIL